MTPKPSMTFRPLPPLLVSLRLPFLLSECPVLPELPPLESMQPFHLLAPPLLWASYAKRVDVRPARMSMDD
jgi:hypothetical protein